MIEETPRNKILTGNVLTVLKSLKKETIDCIVTSPPYYGLRSYGTEPQIWGGKEDCQHEWIDKPYKRNTDLTAGEKQNTNLGSIGRDKPVDNSFCIHCNAWKGELGLEPTFQLYLEHLWMIFDEIKRVLKKTGTCWVNLGDSYGGSGNASGHTENTKNLGYTTANMGATKGHTKNYQAKSLLQIPSRFAIGMTDRGWILRNSIIWYKRNCMPSSARDRFTVDYEMMYFFTKSTKYYFEQQFEPVTDSTKERNKRPHNGGGPYAMNRVRKPGEFANEEQGRNKRCVWDITPKGFKEAHFAVFPPELVETPIKAGCPESICTKCGKIWKPMFEIKVTEHKKREDEKYSGGTDFMSNKTTPRSKTETKFIGYDTCDCNAEIKPGIVLDPFFGSGTTGGVAIKLGRNFLGIELKPEYVEIAERRLNKIGLFLNS